MSERGKLDPYIYEMLELRDQGNSYRQIAEKMNTDYPGVDFNPGSIQYRVEGNTRRKSIGACPDVNRFLTLPAVN